MEEKSCGNCANCQKDSTTLWVCEEYGFLTGITIKKVTPPDDVACEYWTDDPAKANTWMNQL